MTKEKIILENFISESRLLNLKTKLNNRIDHITIVLENLYDKHNISAVVRTAEGLGIQDIHVIDNSNSFEVNIGVSKYSHKWITIHKHKSTEECILTLKKLGFEICVSALNTNSVTLYDVEITGDSKTAFVIGSEHEGVSKKMLQLADKIFIIPMSGFTQSFNVSVAAAIILHYSLEKKRKLIGKSGTLSEKRLNELYSQWLKKSVKHSDKILKATKY